MTDARRIQDQALAITLDERIRSRAVDARWLRAKWLRNGSRDDEWRRDRLLCLLELRALRRLRRDAAAVAAPIVEREEGRAKELAAGDHFAWPA